MLVRTSGSAQSRRQERRDSQDRHEYLDEIVHAWLRAMAPEADDAGAMAIVRY